VSKLDRKRIYDQVGEVVRTLFDEYEGEIGPTLTAKQVSQWDSLANVQFMVLVEQVFKIKFTTAEITGLPNLGALVDLIEKKVG
jgi:acyl carrier protein